MPSGKLKFRERELSVASDTITLGRTSDNDVSFTDDSNVSRYHARIEPRDGEFWLVDLGSSNGTTLNGTDVSGEMPLRDGDEIMLGGSSRIEFAVSADEPSFSPAAAPVNASGPDEPAAGSGDGTEAGSEAGTESKPASSYKNKLIFAGAAVALISIMAIGGVGYYLMSGNSCTATVSFDSPERGSTIVGEAEVEISVKDVENCVAGAVYFIDGKEVASSDTYPYGIKLNANERPELADALPHFLAVVLIDDEGKAAGQSEPIELAFETRRVAKPEPEIVANGPDADGTTGDNTSKQKEVSLIEMNEMATDLAAQFKTTNNFHYNVSNKQFLQEVQKMTKEYALPGNFEKAAKYRDVINVAYVVENNLDASFGYILAMSRSKFDPGKSGAEEGLWRMNAEFVQTNAYNGLCGTETLLDPSQKCAARASANYMKAIVYGVFNGDLVYSAAAFGKSPQDAAVWNASLPSDRSDLWNTIRTPQEREKLVRFFAAALVARDPQKFGLNERPLSELYKLTL